MDRTEYGQGAAQRLYDAEQKLDLALAALNELSAFLTTGRIDQQITAVVGQDALAAITQAQGPVVKARARLLRLRTHSQNSTVAARATADRKTVGHRS
ncbi:hypothetical protein ACETK8_14325 [Brevundimonas staleyi]|uniref:Uncharacterized protein n=1 Tax=Brevundimonas staleyi TaxID=74326 RepID=A0ABW0FW44_9CAUL